MNAVRGIFRNLHRYTLWLIVSIVLWAWIFTLITDAPAQNKLLLYAEVPAMDRAGLAAVLEEDMPDTIRFVEARPGRKVVITTPEKAGAALKGEAGTVIR